MAPTRFLLLCLNLTFATAQTAGPTAQWPFFGKWKLKPGDTKLNHVGDDPKSLQWRTYEPDGDRVRVSWGNGDKPAGTYSAKCDGTPEPITSGKIRCWLAGPNIIDGEQLNESDTTHRYYRRTVSAKGKIMTITWYADANRKRETDRFVYTKD